MDDSNRGWFVNIDRVLDWLRVAAAAVAALWCAIPSLTQLLILLMGVDILLGLILAIRRRDLSVTTAVDGMTQQTVARCMVRYAQRHFVRYLWGLLCNGYV